MGVQGMPASGALLLTTHLSHPTRPLTLLLQQAGRLAQRRYRDHGAADALRALAGVAWLWRHPEQLARLFQEPVLRRWIVDDPQADPLVHASHRDFLVRSLTGRQRIQCARDHYAHEALKFDSRYLGLVYRGAGLTLWRRQTAGHTFTITLCSPAAQRHEGLLSLVLKCGDHTLHRMAFAWVDAGLFCDASIWGPTMLLTRNQTFGAGSGHRQAFEAAFPHNSPAYFCLAAAQGIAALLGHQSMAGIRHADQIAYEPQHAASFQRSYSDFWAQFGGVELHRYAYKLSVPVELKPLSEVKASHRSRARNRRENWQGIFRATGEALGRYHLVPPVFRPDRRQWPHQAPAPVTAPPAQAESAAAASALWP
jgi:uncharacterized protein VirK/YbjX